MNVSLRSRRPLRLVDEIAADLRRLIQGSGLREGDKLPTEKELCDRFEVSRSVIREAVAQLKTESLVDVRHGSGVYVANPEAAMFRITGVTGGFEHFRNVYELRQGIEVAAAGLAADRRTVTDLARLSLAIARMDDPRTRACADIDFHSAVATATRNPLYESFVGFIGNAVASAIEGAVRNTMERHGAAQARVIAEHNRVLAAIRACDARRAERAMASHIQAAMRRLSIATKATEALSHTDRVNPATSSGG